MTRLREVVVLIWFVCRSPEGARGLAQIASHFFSQTLDSTVDIDRRHLYETTIQKANVIISPSYKCYEPEYGAFFNGSDGMLTYKP